MGLDDLRGWPIHHEYGAKPGSLTPCALTP